MEKLVTIGVAFFISCLAAAPMAAAPVASPSSEAARLVARYLPRMHISHRSFNDAISTNALSNYLNTLDYEHCYFLAADIESFQKYGTLLDNETWAGDVSFAFKAYDVLRERVSNRVAYVDTVLKKGFNIEDKETYEWKRKDAPWASNEAEWNELWRKRIKNQYVARLVSDRIAEEEKKAAPPIQNVDTNPPPEAVEPQLSPKEFILKGYQQYLTMLNDNDAEWPIERYLSAFTQAYDPHSDYLTANNTEDFDISMKLSLVGIGAVLTSEDGAAKIERLIAGGPAEKDGRLKAHDKIIAVAQGDGKPVSIMHWPLNKAVRVIRGTKGTKVVLTVIPASDVSGSTTKNIDLIRDEVKLEDQAAKSSIQEIKGTNGITQKIGIIRVPEFYADVKSKRENGNEPRSVTRDVAKILWDLKTNLVAGVILDLRNNGGGLLAEAVEMTGLFIDSGPVVQVSDGRGVGVLSDDDPDVIYSGPLVALVNRQTASAAEILAGALQDYGRAVIVGDTKTHGKGTVQTMTNLKSNDPSLGSLKVTTASFYRIAGGSTQLKGVVPDIALPTILDSMEVGEEYLPNAIPWSVVEPAFYVPSSRLKPILADLERKSEERRNQDPHFKAYGDLIRRLSERQKEKVISLNFKDRLALARSEKELQKMIQAADSTDGEEDSSKTDILLGESLNILSDLITLEKKSDSAMATTTF